MTPTYRVLERLDDHARTTLDGLASQQNVDGGFPETFVGDASGCWTTAELLAAIAGSPSRAVRDDEVLAAASNYLHGVWQRHGDGGLPYHEHGRGTEAANATGPAHATRRERSVVDVTAAFLLGRTALYGRADAVAERTREWLRGARARGPGSGFGVLPSDGRPRLYSTGYALLALDDLAEIGSDIDALRTWQDASTGAWPFRPERGVPPSRLGTVLALAVFARHGMLTAATCEKAVEWLLDRLEHDDVLDEDSFVVPEGYRLSFLYAPRLVAIGRILELALADPYPRDPDEHERLVSRIALALVRYERELRRAGRPQSRLGEARMWHDLDLLYGHASVRRAMSSATPALRDLFDHHLAATSARVASASLARDLPLPLRATAGRLAGVRRIRAETSEALFACFEQTFQFCEAVLLASLRTAGATGIAALGGRLAVPAVGSRDVKLAVECHRAVFGDSAADTPLASRLAAQLTDVERVCRKELGALRDGRNRVAHGAAAFEPQKLASLVAAWVAVLDGIAALRDVELLQIERLGHVSQTVHLYQWTSIDDPERVFRTRSETTIEDVVTIGRNEEARAAFVGDRRRPAASPLSMSPFALLGPCDVCLMERLFVYSGRSITAQGAALRLRCASGCGQARVVTAPRTDTSG